MCPKVVKPHLRLGKLNLASHVLDEQLLNRNEPKSVLSHENIQENSFARSRSTFACGSRRPIISAKCSSRSPHFNDTHDLPKRKRTLRPVALQSFTSAPRVILETSTALRSSSCVGNHRRSFGRSVHHRLSRGCAGQMINFTRRPTNLNVTILVILFMLIA